MKINETYISKEKYMTIESLKALNEEIMSVLNEVNSEDYNNLKHWLEETPRFSPELENLLGVLNLGAYVEYADEPIFSTNVTKTVDLKKFAQVSKVLNKYLDKFYGLFEDTGHLSELVTDSMAYLGDNGLDTNKDEWLDNINNAITFLNGLSSVSNVLPKNINASDEAKSQLTKEIVDILSQDQLLNALTSLKQIFEGIK